MKLSGAQLVLMALQDEGINVSFGIPGTHNIELYDAMLDTDFVPVLVTDEQSASFMADGYARSSGKVAVVNVVPGAGVTHAMSGIAEAYLDQIPMIVLACGIRRDTHHAFQLHAVDQAAIARPVCKKTFSITSHQQIYPYVRKACEIAKQAPQGPVFIEVPANLYLFPSNLSREDVTTTTEGPQLPRLNPPLLDKAAKLINESRGVAIYAGLGALAGREELIRLAEHLDAITYTTISGKGTFPEDHPLWAWNVMGAASPKKIQKLENDVDCILAVGCRFAEVATASYGLDLKGKRLIHVDIDSQVFNKNYPADVALHADAKDFMAALLASGALKKRGPDAKKREELAFAHQTVRREQSLNKSKTRVSPHTLITTMQEIFGDDTIYATDSGNGTFLAMEYLRLKNPRSFIGPIDYSCMGYSVPAALGAKMANPDKPVVALVGDGAFLMTGLEILTSNSYKCGVAFVILNDGELSQIAQFQRRTLGRENCTELAQISYEPLCQALGVHYLSIKTDADITETLAKARELTQQNQPVLIETLIDYSFQTYFTAGVIKTNLLRLPWKDRFRFVGRVVKRKLFK